MALTPARRKAVKTSSVHSSSFDRASNTRLRSKTASASSCGEAQPRRAPASAPAASAAEVRKSRRSNRWIPMCLSFQVPGPGPEDGGGGVR